MLQEKNVGPVHFLQGTESGQKVRLMCSCSFISAYCIISGFLLPMGSKMLKLIESNFWEKEVY